MGWLWTAGVTLGAMAASFLPYRLWPRMPSSFQMTTSAFLAGVVTFFAGAAVGVPGFLEHAHAQTSTGLDLALAHMEKTEIYRGDLVMGHSGLAVFTFLLLTPKGWATLYLMISGGVRMAAAWFDDPVGDPLVTGLDEIIWRRRARAKARRAMREREALEGPEVPDRIASPASAGIPDCDFVIVASRRKPGWEFGTAVYTQTAVYRIGLPIERTIAGRLRSLYPLTEHKDFEAIRRSVHYDLPKTANERSE